MMLFVSGVALAQNSMFEPLYGGQSDMVDVDSDGDLDIVYYGISTSSSSKFKIMLNDGAGHFTENTSHGIPGVALGDMDWSDIDGDGDQDFLLIASTDNSPWDLVSLYINDGTGQFTLETNHPFFYANTDEFQFADVNGDGSEDMILFGHDFDINTGWNFYGELFFNDGSGTFTQYPTPPFTPTTNHDMEVIDLDGDSDLDIVISGDDANNDEITSIYLNNGLGGFTPMSTSGLMAPGFNPTVACADFLNGDGNPDLLIMGFVAGSGLTTEIYTNSGTPTFSPITYVPVPPTSIATATFANLDSDNYPELIVTGNEDASGTSPAVTRVYYNIYGSGLQLMTQPIPGLFSATINSGDIDSDGDIDLFFTGKDSDDNGYSELFLNDGNGFFSAANAPVSNEEQANLNMSFYPNPASEVLVVAAHSPQVRAHWWLIDACGRMVQEGQWPAVDTEMRIDVTGLDPGLYFYQQRTGVQAIIIAK